MQYSYEEQDKMPVTIRSFSVFEILFCSPKSTFVFCLADRSGVSKMFKLSAPARIFNILEMQPRISAGNLRNVGMPDS
jgi:hypothetical protein